MVRVREDLEKQLEEQKVALEQQQQRYQETEARHKTELEQIRQAGHDSLAMIVEEYKVSMPMGDSKSKMEVYTYLHILIIQYNVYCVCHMTIQGSVIDCHMTNYSCHVTLLLFLLP